MNCIGKKKKHLENRIFPNALLLFVCDYFFWFQIVNLASAITSLWAFYCGRIAWSGPQPRSWGGDGKSIKATTVRCSQSIIHVGFAIINMQTGWRIYKLKWYLNSLFFFYSIIIKVFFINCFIFVKILDNWCIINVALICVGMF